MLGIKFQEPEHAHRTELYKMKKLLLLPFLFLLLVGATLAQSGNGTYGSGGYGVGAYGTSPVTAAANDLTFDRIKGMNANEGGITGDLNLPTVGKSGTNTTISWAANSTLIRLSDGRVTRPAFEESDTPVMLNASIKRANYTTTNKTFSLVIKKKETSDAAAVAVAKSNVTFDVIKQANADLSNVLTDLYLPAKWNDTTLSWSSSNSNVISSSGSVSRQSADTSVTLTLTITRGSSSDSKTFSLTVKGTTDPDEQEIAGAKTALTETAILNGNPSVSNVVGRLYLPASVKSYPNVAISWSSSDASVIVVDTQLATGNVTRSASDDKLVNMTANLSKSGKSALKIFSVTVKKTVAAKAPENNRITIDQGESEIVIDNTNANSVSIIAVNSSTDASQAISINLDSLRNSTGALTTGASSLSLSRDTGTASYAAVISDNTVVTGAPSWNGIINVPTVKTASDYTAPTGSVDTVVDVGTGSELNFSKSVKITIGGKAGKSAAWSRGTGSLAEITTLCNNANNPTNINTVSPRECYITVGSDLVIWTYHFTEFAAYTPPAATSSSSSSSSGGGGGGSACTAEYKLLSPSGVEGKAGSTVTIPVTFSSTGTCSGSATITASVPVGWSATSAYTNIVGVGKSATVNITVTIPANASNGTVTFNTMVSNKALSSKTTVSIVLSSATAAAGQPRAAETPVAETSPTTKEKPAETAIPLTGQVTGNAVADNNGILIAGGIVVIIIIAFVSWHIIKKRRAYGPNPSNVPKPPAPKPQPKMPPPKPAPPKPQPAVQVQKLKVTSVSNMPRTQSVETKAKFEYKDKKRE